MYTKSLPIQFLNFSLLAAVIIFSASCQKNIDPVKATTVMNLSVTSFSTNADAAFAVVVNDHLTEDSLYNGFTSINLVPKVDGMQHVVIRDSKTKSVLIDTLLDMPGNKALLTLLQLQAEDNPILVGQSEEDIPDHHRLQAFFYTGNILPDNIGCQVYACHYDAGTFELKKTDTLATYPVIKKGELSPFLLIPDSKDPSTIIYFFQPLDVETLKPLPNQAMPFDPANYSGYTFSFDPTVNGTEQHYINNIIATGSPEFFDVFSNRLISY